jgi:stearoyl-CoA desaturase (delta-9 desaturase)
MRNATLKFLSEETYVVPHHVHHRFADQPGDPYNPNGGWLYVYFARANHQSIATDLSPSDYARAASLLAHVGVVANTYAQYQRWGSIAHPLRTLVHFALNWFFWGAIFYAIGGMSLLTAVFGFGWVWTFSIRTFNFNGHHPKKAYRDGIDFDRRSHALNQFGPGLIAGEWHNNHHLFPKSARTGFLPGQIDTPWWIISAAHKLGIVASLNDQREEFLRDHAPAGDAILTLS